MTSTDQRSRLHRELARKLLLWQRMDEVGLLHEVQLVRAVCSVVRCDEAPSSSPLVGSSRDERLRFLILDLAGRMVP